MAWVDGIAYTPALVALVWDDRYLKRSAPLREARRTQRLLRATGLRPARAG